MINFYQHLPLHINPIAFTIGFFAVRWYAISYIVGFLTVYLVLMWRIRRGEIIDIAQISNFKFIISKQFSNSKSQIQNDDTKSDVKCQLSIVTLDFLLVAFFSALVGGRLGYVLFYNAPYYFANPLAIISPYDFQSGQYVGLFGMSYHGALLGIVVGSYIFLKKKNINFFAWADFVIPAAALGYFFGRVGNFLNGELYGRLTSSPLGMYFSADPTHLRHPSQLYEAFLEGLLLFFILWKMRSRKLKRGALFAIYLIGYGLLRILAEQFREPDPQLGFLWNYFTMGQILSFVMVTGGLFLMISKNEK